MDEEPERESRGSPKPGGGAKPSDNARRMFPYRFLAIAGLLAMLLGGVYTVAGQDKSESNPRFVTISVSGPSSDEMSLGGSARFSISTTNALGDGYSWNATSTSKLSDSSSCTRSGSWTGSPSRVTAYGCRTGSASVTARLYFTDVDSGTIQLVDTGSDSVTIIDTAATATAVAAATATARARATATAEATATAQVEATATAQAKAMATAQAEATATAQAKATATAQAEATATAQAEATATAQAEATATAQAEATATAEAQRPPPTPPLSTPPKVQNLIVSRAAPGYTPFSVWLRWTAIANTTYQVQRRIGTTGSWGTVFPVPDPYSIPRLTHSNIYLAVCGQESWFQVAAKRGTGGNQVLGPYSDPVSITVPCTAPGPRYVEASNSTKTSFSISWTLVPDASAYKVERRRASSTYWESAHSGISEISGSPYTTTGLYCGTDYYFRVRARGDGDPYTLRFGEPSVEEGPEDTDDCGTNPPPPPPTPPSGTPLPVPTGLTDGEFTDSAGRRVLTLDWDDVAGTGITYRLQIRDAETRWSCSSDTDCTEETSPQQAWTQSGEIDFSAADYRYPVDGRRYEYQVRSVLGQMESDWSATHTTARQTAIPHLGHQQDHTVMYELGTGTSTGVISESIQVAARAWNDSSLGTSWPNLLICEEGSHGCASLNTDGHKVTIQVADQWSPGCGPYISACVRPKTIAADEAFHTFNKHTKEGTNPGKSAPWQHMKDLHMIIDDPAQKYDITTKKYTPVLWTRDYTLDNTNEPTGELWIYLPGLVMHEFGHTLGLADLYNYPGHPGYLMTDNRVIADTMKAGGHHPSRAPAPAIPRKDIDYVRQVYRNGHGTEPH